MTPTRITVGDMKIYDFTPAPNPRRVRVFLAEKGLKIPYEQVDLFKGENRKPEFLAKNPFGGLPVLEMDDGTYLAESVAICRYFEELHPEPPLMGGSNAKERALVEMWNRRVELGLMGEIGRMFQHTFPFFKDRIKQIPEFAQFSRERAIQSLKLLDGILAGSKFIAGARYTIADITALIAIDLGKLVEFTVPAELKNVTRWYGEVSSRPSAKA